MHTRFVKLNPIVKLLRYNAVEEFNVDSKAEYDQLNLAHKTKTNNCQCPLSSVQVQDP